MPVLSGDGQQAFYLSHTRIATSAGAGIGFSSGQVGQSCEIADPVNVGAGDLTAGFSMRVEPSKRVFPGKSCPTLLCYRTNSQV